MKTPLWSLWRNSFFQAEVFRRLLPLALAVCVSGCETQPARQARLTGAAQEFAAREKQEEERERREGPLLAMAPGYHDPDPIVDLGPPWGKWRTSALKKKMSEIEAQRHSPQ
ncbi:MAG: hypothetical protein ABJF10_12085 [Chthoniobacter sp.]|uniref:hypothetical protein n=1 Tax=Chthoniobacter sp. TaxID=2510640 RepID=UPI0032A924A8